MTTIADASDAPLWGWHAWVAFLTLDGLAALLTPRLTSVLHGVRRWHQREPVSLDALDGVDVPERCSVARPHRMLPTEYGWRCANDCGERWYIDPADQLAVADLALWEIENDWEVEA